MESRKKTQIKLNEIKLNCPCEDCICLAICKHKTYSHFINDCSTIEKWMEYPYSISATRDKAFKCLLPITRPTKWQVVSRHNIGGGYLRVIQESDKIIPWEKQLEVLSK